MSTDELDMLRLGGKRALAMALAALEHSAVTSQTLALLDTAWAAPAGRVIGLTGPPGVGKSTLLSALAMQWRASGRTVGIIAVDPSSATSGGALLGDRTRLDVDPADQGVFVRSLAARDRLGGTAALCGPITALFAALFDITVIETVGIGQSETEVADLVDMVVLAIQPASGDVLQFMKAGILEIPDIAVVTKADLGAPADRAARDLEAAFGLVEPERQVDVLLVAAPSRRGLPELIEAIDRRSADGAAGNAGTARERRARRWIEASLREEIGRRGLLAARVQHAALLTDARLSPFRRVARLLDI